MKKKEGKKGGLDSGWAGEGIYIVIQAVFCAFADARHRLLRAAWSKLRQGPLAVAWAWRTIHAAWWLRTGKYLRSRYLVGTCQPTYLPTLRYVPAGSHCQDYAL